MAQNHYKRLHDGDSPARSGLMAKPPRFDASGYRNAARLTKDRSAFQPNTIGQSRRSCVRLWNRSGKPSCRPIAMDFVQVVLATMPSRRSFIALNLGPSQDPYFLRKSG